MQNRKFTRHPTDISIKFMMETMIGEHHHYLKDAGRGGLCFESHGWIQPGTNLRICIPFSDEPCNTGGKIAWCRKDDCGYYLMGVEFNKSVSETDIKKIHLIERYKNRIHRKMGVRMTSEEAERKMQGMPLI